jgi:hypothetical protein
MILTREVQGGEEVQDGGREGGDTGGQAQQRGGGLAAQHIPECQGGLGRDPGARQPQVARPRQRAEDARPRREEGLEKETHG